MSREDPGRRVPGEDPEDTPEEDSPYPWMRLEEEDSAPPFRPWMIVVAGLSVAIFVVAVWYAWSEGQSTNDGPPPVVEAEDSPVKTPPEEPGGMDVPHQEKTVFNAIEDDGGEKAESEEELLPPPEEPVDRPAEEKTADADQPAALEEKPATDTAPDDTTTDGEEMAAAETDVGANAETETAADQAAQSEPAGATGQEETEEPAPAESGQAESTQGESAQTEAAATGDYAVQLAAVGEREAAEGAWGRFVKDYPRLLGPLTRDIQPVEVNGRTLYRVLAAGIADRTAAEALCQDLKDQGQSCLVKEQ